MPLYRRVFPDWYERSWNPRASIEPKKRKHETFDADDNGLEGGEESKDATQMSDWTQAYSEIRSQLVTLIKKEGSSS